MTGYATLPCEVYRLYSFLTMIGHGQLCRGWMQGWHATLVVAGSILGWVKIFLVEVIENRSLHSK